MSNKDKVIFENTPMPPIADNAVMTTKIYQGNVSVTGFSRFNEELINKYFSDAGKAAIKEYVNQQVLQALVELRKETSQNPAWPTSYEFSRSEFDVAIGKIQEKYRG